MANGILPALAPCGNIRTADSAQAYPHGLSRKRLEIGGTQKNPLAKRLGFFVWSPSALGLLRASSP